MMQPGSFRRSLAPLKSTVAPVKCYMSTQSFTVENTGKVRIQKPSFTSKKLCTTLSKLSRTWRQQNCFGALLKRNFQKFQCLDDSENLPWKKNFAIECLSTILFAKSKFMFFCQFLLVEHHETCQKWKQQIFIRAHLNVYGHANNVLMSRRLCFSLTGSLRQIQRWTHRHSSHNVMTLVLIPQLLEIYRILSVHTVVD